MGSVPSMKVQVMVYLAIAMGLTAMPLGKVHGQPQLTPALDRARREPIADGRGAAGLRLGDQIATVTNTLGSPFKVETFEAGARQDFLYAAFGPGEVWGLVITAIIRQNPVQAIEIVSARRPPEAHPYLGSTTLGYRLVDPGSRLRALYGAPDLVIVEHRREYWWYQRAGIVVTPDERVIQGEAERALILLSPNASLIEVRRLLNLPTGVIR